MATTAERVSARDIQDRLHAALLPFAAPVAAPKLRKVLEQTAADSPGIVELTSMATESLAELMRGQQATEEEIATQLVEFERLANDPAETAKSNAEFCEQETAHACVVLLTAWAGICLRTATAAGGGTLAIDAANFDDAMLPRGPKAVFDTQFANRFDNAVIDHDDGLAILRAYRASLPEGTRAPADFVALLASHGVTVLHATA